MTLLGRKPRTLVIIPAFNEEKNLPGIIYSLKKRYLDFEVLVIDDGSTDSTATRAKEAGAILLSHPIQLGYGSAIQTGYKFAYARNYDFLLQMDGDGQHDVEGLSAVYDELLRGQADLILGSRFHLKEKSKNQFFSSIRSNLTSSAPISFQRRVGMRLFRNLVNFITKLKLSDVTTGFQGMNRNVLSEFIQDSFPFDYPDADTIVMAHKRGLRIGEVPVTMYATNTGKSMHSSPYKVLVYVLQSFIALFVLLMQRQRRNNI